MNRLLSSNCNNWKTDRNESKPVNNAFPLAEVCLDKLGPDCAFPADDAVARSDDVDTLRLVADLVTVVG